MSPRIAVVTDSTLDLDVEEADALDLRVVPMTVTFGEESFISRMSISTPEFYRRLQTSDVLPTTSQPAPAWFEEAYADAADEGCDGVVSVHVSGALSGTLGVAQSLAETAPIPVRVVDSRQVSGGLLLVALAAQAAARSGADLDAVVAEAERASERVHQFVVVDTLDYLRRGGRLSGAQALLGNVLRVKPVLTVVEGEVRPLERTRTWSRALPRLAELVAGVAGDRPLRVVVNHAVAPERAAELWALLEERVEIAERIETLVGPIVGAHCGPGTVGVSVVPLEPA